jgi:tRNA wybutosine-synthesizing protein 1
MESHTGIKISESIDQPDDIIENCIKGQWTLINGFGGNPKLNREKFEEAKNPNQFAISLTGEPTIYPKLNELIKKLHERDCTTFVVTNGMFPDKLKNIEPPTQLYMSLDAPNKEIFSKVNKPTQNNSWEKLNQSLEILNDLRQNKKTRTVLRITVVKGYNDINPEQYAELIKKANPMFVEVKAYMFIGSSILRLKIENMPRHDEVREFSEQIASHLGWKIVDEAQESRVVLLAEKDHEDRLI